MSPISALVVDDHAVFADALGARLAAEVDIAPVSVAYGLDQARARLAAEQPDIALVDVHLAEGSGLEVAEFARALSPQTRVMMLTATDSVDAAVEALLMGVRGWLSKAVDTAELLRAVRAVHAGAAWLEPMLLSRVLPALVQRTLAPPADPLGALTAREREVLNCLADGYSRADTAAQLHLSINTVRSHIQNLTAKLDVHSTLEAAALRNRHEHRRRVLGAPRSDRPV